jgi:lipopolysaccharide assembly outer membrane protein LptD (OstA)
MSQFLTAPSARIALALLCLISVSGTTVAQDNTCEPSAPLSFRVSELFRDGSDQFILRGNVWLCFEGNVVTAQEIVFEHSSQRSWAIGKVQVRDRNGNTTSAERVDFGPELTRAFISRRLDQP